MGAVRRDSLHCRACYVHTACAEQQFACRGRPCIDVRRQCDGRFDCPDLSDERNCACNTSSHLTLCRSSQLCVGRCDGVVDCDDFTDEAGCGLCVASVILFIISINIVVSTFL